MYQKIDNSVIDKKYRDFIDRLRKSYKPQEICSNIKYFDSTKHKMLTEGINETDKISTKSLGVLEFIDNDCRFPKNITDIGNLIAINGDLKFFDSKIDDLKNLKVVMGDVVFEKYQKDIGKLEYIGGNAIFEDSGITDLKGLTAIGLDVIFEKSKVVNLGNLIMVGGNANFEDSKIEDLKNLHSIGGSMWMGNVKNLGKLSSVFNSIFGNNTPEGKREVRLALEHIDKMKNIHFIKNQLCYVKNNNFYDINGMDRDLQSNILLKQYPKHNLFSRNFAKQKTTNKIILDTKNYGLIIGDDGSIILSVINPL